MLKKLLSILLALVFAVTLLSGTVTAYAGNTTEFMDGSGTADDPYLISNQTHLLNVKLYPSAHFLLLRDLTVGNMGLTGFSGVFDGNGHTISGLTAPFTATLYGTVKNLTLSGTVSGGLFAQTVETSGTVSGCRSRGTVTGSYAGGICATGKGTIILSSNEARVTATKYAGGIAGELKGTVSRSYNIGTVLSESYAGGISGYGGRVENSYNMGLVGPTNFARIYAGGISGYVSKAVNCYNVGTVKGHYAGGIAGSASTWLDAALASTEGCYFLDNIKYSNGFNAGAYATRCTMEEMTLQSTFTAFDFDEIWQMDGGAYGLPVLRGSAVKGYTDDSGSFAGGEGVFYAPYLIATEAQLKNINLYPDRHYLLANDISLTRENWIPLCPAGFLGVFDGGDHTLSGLYHYYNYNSMNGTSHIAGLFADNCGVIRDLKLSDVTLRVRTSDQQSRATVGTIAVTSHEGTFENCHVLSGTVQAETYYNSNWGGIVGDLAGEATAGGLCADGTGTFINCSNAASVSSYSEAGGIAANGTTFIGCVNSGSVSVSATTYTEAHSGLCAGGIVAIGAGYGAVTDCVNSGTVTVSNTTGTVYTDLYAGGIAGRGGSSVTACKNTGTVTAHCTWPKSERPTSSPTPFAGGIVGSASAEISQCVNEGAVYAKAGNAQYSSNGYTDAYAGGIAASGTTITDCVNSGDVTCFNSYYFQLKNYLYSGDIAGSASAVRTCYTISNPFGPAQGSLEANSTAYAGALVGKANVLADSYFLTTWTSLYPEHGRTAEQLTLQATYEGFDFIGVWGFDLLSDYDYALPLHFISPAAEVTLNGDPEIEVLEGMTPDFSSLSVTVTNGAGESVTSPVESWMVEQADTSKPGTVSLSVFYGGVTADQKILLTVKAKSAVSLTVTTLPSKTTYIKDEEELDLTGGVFTVEYDNLTQKEFPMTEAQVTGFDGSVPGEQLLTLSYGGLSTTFPVTVIAPVGISVAYMPRSAERDIVNVAPDLSGIGVVLVYSDNSRREIPESELTVSYDFSAPGETEVTVMWNGMTTRYQTIVWEAVPTYVELIAEPSRLSFWKGEPLDLSGSLVDIRYTVDNDMIYFTRWVRTELTHEMVAGYDPNAVGFQTVRVTYGNCTDDFIVQVKSLITDIGTDFTDEGLSLRVDIHENGRAYTYLLVAYRQGRLVSCAMVTQPAGTEFSRTLEDAREGDTVLIYVLDGGFLPIIPATAATP